MNAKYQDMYKGLIKAYYDRTFETELTKILEEADDRQEVLQVIATLSGIEDIPEELSANDHQFINAVISAITRNEVREKIVRKVGTCSKDCETKDGRSKCMNVCPFDAIVRVDETSDKKIDEELCMSCGRCVNVCENGHFQDVPQALPLVEMMKQHKKVYAIVAPAIAGQFGKDVTLDQLREAFIKIGFTDMVEVAMAADVLSMKEAMEYNELVTEEGDFMITSCCCPMWIAMLRKLYNDLIPEISPSVSPMVAMGRILKKLESEAKVVFVGPCIAKKAEAKEPDICDAVDHVLTFEETKLLFEAYHIDVTKLHGVPTVDYASAGGRLYARAGGVSQAIWDIIDEMYPEKRKLFSSVHVDGIPDCKKILKELEDGTVRASFIEGMGCKGGCVGGPKRIIPVEEGTQCVNNKARDSAIKMPMHSAVIIRLLNEIGIRDLQALRDDHSMFERKF